MTEPLEQLKALLPLWRDSKSSYADDQFLGAAVRRIDLEAIVAWAEGLQRGGWAGRAAELQRQLAEAEDEIDRQQRQNNSYWQECHAILDAAGIPPCEPGTVCNRPDCNSKVAHRLHTALEQKPAGFLMADPARSRGDS